MPIPTDFQGRRGTVAVTFTQNGTYSTWADMGGMRLVGLYAPAWPGGAGSLTFRASWDGAGAGQVLANEAGSPLRVVSFGSTNYVSFTPGTVPIAARFVACEVGTAGTAGVAGGGTVYLVGEA
jgi:hypothetical protein